MKKILVIGHFGFKENLLNGQTIKTKTITSEIKKRYGDKNVLTIDTRGGVFKRLFAFLRIFIYFFNVSDIVFLPAQSGIRKILPILTSTNKVFKRKLHYIVVGGWIGDVAETNKKILKNLKKVDCIYPETKLIESQLNRLGITNTFVMPNGKKLKILTESDLHSPDHQLIKLCTFSRVSKQKGLEDAINAVTLVNRESNVRFSLDIYGQISDTEKEWFELLTKLFNKDIKYCGQIGYKDSVDCLSKYDILLFPTYYEGEGFAGTIVDAFSAGLPVIASNWKSNSEIVDEKTGFLFETHNIEDLKNKILLASKDLNHLFDMKKECIKKASNYRIDCVIQILCNNILNKNEVSK